MVSDIYFSIQVTGARLKLETIGSEIRNIKDLVWGLVSVFLYTCWSAWYDCCFQVYINSYCSCRMRRWIQWKLNRWVSLRNGYVISVLWFVLFTRSKTARNNVFCTYEQFCDKCFLWLHITRYHCTQLLICQSWFICINQPDWSLRGKSCENLLKSCMHFVDCCVCAITGMTCLPWIPLPSSKFYYGILISYQIKWFLQTVKFFFITLKVEFTYIHLIWWSHTFFFLW
jgi:hypothetical protein